MSAMSRPAPWRSAGALRRLAVAEARRRPGRVVVTLLTVALGAGALTTALTLGDSVQTAIRDGLAVEYRGADIVVRSEIAAAEESADTLLGSPSTAVTVDDLDEILGLPGVATAASMVRATAVAQVGDVARGISIESLPTATSMQWQGWIRGRPPANGTEIALSQYALDELRIGLGDQVALGHPGVGRALFTVVGIVDTRGSLTRQSTTYGITTAPVAQSLAGWPQLTRDLVSASADAEGARVGALGAVVAALAAIASLGAAITAVTTTAAGLATRRRTWALARCIGADRRQVGLLVATEALLLGVAGAVVGVLAGLLIARLCLPLVGLVPGLPRLEASSFTVERSSLLVPLALSAALALAGSLVPAWLAARIAPSAALRQLPPRRAARHLMPVVALVLLALGVAAARFGADERSPWWLAGGALLAIVAVGLALTSVLAVGARVVAARFPSTPARRLGLLDVVRRPRAAATEAVAVALAVGMIAMSWVAIGSVQEATSARLSESSLPDLVIGAEAGAGVIASSTVEALDDIDGVAEAVPVEFGVDVSITGRGERSTVTLANGTAAANAHELGEVLPDGLGGEVVRDHTVYLPKAAFPPYPAGEKVTLKGPDGTLDGLAVEYVDDLGLPAAVSPTTLAKVSEKRETRLVWLALEPGANRAAVTDEITGAAILAGQHPVSGPVITDLRVTEALTTARAAAVAILAIAVVVAAIGAAATASLTVAERARAMPSRNAEPNSVGFTPANVAFTVTISQDNLLAPTREVACWLPDDTAAPTIARVPIAVAVAEVPTGADGLLGGDDLLAGAPGATAPTGGLGGLSDIGLDPAAAETDLAASAPQSSVRQLLSSIPPHTRVAGILLPTWLLLLVGSLIPLGAVAYAVSLRRRLALAHGGDAVRRIVVQRRLTADPSRRTS